MSTQTPHHIDPPKPTAGILSRMSDDELNETLLHPRILAGLNRTWRERIDAGYYDDERLLKFSVDELAKFVIEDCRDDSAERDLELDGLSEHDSNGEA